MTRVTRQTLSEACPASMHVWRARTGSRRSLAAHGAARAPAANAGARVPVARPPADGRGQARRRGLLVARRQAAGLPERARARQSRSTRSTCSTSTTGETKRISPGMGKTTCAFFRPGTDQILFASTHHDPKSKQLPGRRAGVPRVGQGAALRLGLRPGDGDLRVRREDRRADAADQRARLRRRGQLLARRPVDRRSRRCATPTTAR